MKRSQAEVIEILLKNIINMHEKLNIISDKLALSEEIDEIIEKPNFIPKGDRLIEIDKSTYQQMCEMMGEGTIPFMGIA